ncbi:ABC transporter ATP-binding protein [Leptothrix discophora]|uniref:ATP-binding cassette domain-containing protein n=1 Tax=Leptothrix discophora TaxID=89 RepID=A0ABT9G165_LEPDI|nr:ATP-binding cassette domain-containing protein [Leptothrix discophora]MDP4300207.1 ATP-binding cassette domain-containing protein [Leptothrix discophora]
MHDVRLSGIRKSYTSGTTVIPGLDLEIPAGSFTVLVGPSGCGKSTLLRMVAGLESVSGGQILIGGRDVTHLEPAARGIAMVFQSYALYPHMTVAENIGFPLTIARRPKAEIDAAVQKAADVLQLGHLLQRTPKALSGGQRQRVAIGRAIVRNPSVFLFDEPLSNLDASLRGQMRVELADLHRQIGATMIYVTHDQVEAMTMADQIVVLNKGHIEQAGSPMDLYRQPATPFVAGFLGAPSMNLFEGTLAREMGCETYGVRPEHVDIHADGDGEDKGVGRWPATIRHIEHLGADAIVYADVREVGTFTVRAEGELSLQVGQAVRLSPRSGHEHRFQGGRRLAA